MNLTRIFTFLIGCIGIRLSLVYIAKNYTNYLPIMGKLALLPAIGFTIIYLNDFINYLHSLNLLSIIIIKLIYFFKRQDHIVK